jgi:uncharacterized protein (TIGR00255 family)
MYSMTAFARTMVQGPWGTAVWELKSLNHRFLEASFRLPDLARELEPALRERLKGKINRGRLECNLRFTPANAESISYSESQVAALLATVEQLDKQYPHISLSQIDPLKLLAWPGILTPVDHSSNFELIAPELIQAFEEAIERLMAARKVEGKSIHEILGTLAKACSKRIDQLEMAAPLVLKQVQNQCREKISELGASQNNDRLEQELLFWAQRMDVAEELERLKEHLKELARQFKLQEPIGRRLDFLMQELQREANTLGSKLQDPKITPHVIELKVHIEQMREQIQNLE